MMQYADAKTCNLAVVVIAYLLRDLAVVRHFPWRPAYVLSSDDVFQRLAEES
jgi:hypothetical protein